jgi:hypothetical protein
VHLHEAYEAAPASLPAPVSKAMPAKKQAAVVSRPAAGKKKQR